MPSPRPLGPGTALPPAYTSTDQLAVNVPSETPAQKRQLLLQTLSGKIAKKSNALAAQLSNSVESHLQTHRKLTANAQRLQSSLKVLEEESFKVQKNLTALEAHTREMDEALSRIQAMPDVDVDSLGTQQSVPVNQYVLHSFFLLED
jgi:uncharacterized membrane protein YheB (UPF0754 family)